jgi:hypothetical protein
LNEIVNHLGKRIDITTKSIEKNKLLLTKITNESKFNEVINKITELEINIDELENEQKLFQK